MSLSSFFCAQTLVLTVEAFISHRTCLHSGTRPVGRRRQAPTHQGVCAIAVRMLSMPMRQRKRSSHACSQ